MGNQLQIFENQEFGRLEILTIDGKPHFPATECAKTLGYSNAQDAVRRHCRCCVKHAVPHPQSSGKNIQMMFIPEGDLYRLIIRSKLPAAVRFEAWICDEVIPAIRQYGAYITKETLAKMSQDRNYTNQIIDTLTELHSQNTALLDYVEVLAPKVRYYDTILQCQNALQTSILAKDYGMSCVAFNKLLYGLKIQFKIGKTWLLYKDFADKGYTISKTYYVGGRIASINTCWTQKGRLWLYDVLKGYGILPLAERMTEN